MAGLKLPHIWAVLISTNWIQWVVSKKETWSWEDDMLWEIREDLMWRRKYFIVYMFDILKNKEKYIYSIIMLKISRWELSLCIWCCRNKYDIHLGVIRCLMEIEGLKTFSTGSKILLLKCIYSILGSWSSLVHYPKQHIILSLPKKAIHSSLTFPKTHLVIIWETQLS